MMSRSPLISRMKGFSLVELMVVIMIVGILAAIAIPTYQNQIRKGRRTDAKTAVLDLASREEKYFSLSNSYTNSSTNLGYPAGGFPQYIGANQYYQIFVCPGTATTSSSTVTPCTGASTAATGSSYVVSAIPVAGTSQAQDGACQYYAIDNTGTQFASSTAGIGTNTTTTCWQ